MHCIMDQVAAVVLKVNTFTLWHVVCRNVTYYHYSCCYRYIDTVIFMTGV